MQNYFIKNFIVFFLLFAPAVHAAAPKAVTKDPYKFVWEKDEGENAGLIRFFLDINGDEIADLFVGSKSLMGNGGGVFHVFLVSKDREYKPLGKLEIHPSAIEILPTKHHGVHDIKHYWHMSAMDGNVNTFVFDGQEFKAGKSRKVASDDSSQMTPVKVSTEESGKTLNWKP